MTIIFISALSNEPQPVALEGYAPAELARSEWRAPHSYRLSSPLIIEDSFGASIVVASRTSTGATADARLSLGVTKFGLDGSQAWEFYYDDPYGRSLIPESVTTDSLGNVIVAGIIESDHLFVIKLTSEGARLWASASQSKNGFGATQLFVDDAGNIITWSAGDAPSRAWQSPPLGQTDWYMDDWNPGGMSMLTREGHFAMQPFNFRTKGISAVATARLEGSNIEMTGWTAAGFGTFTLNLASGNISDSNVWGAFNPRRVLLREAAGSYFVFSEAAETGTLRRYSRGGALLWSREVGF